MSSQHRVKASEAVLKEMAEIAQRLAIPQTGMTAKNRARLRATDDPAALERLGSLPWTLKAEIDAGKHGPVHSRVLAELAAMIAIEFVAPLDPKSAALEIGRHLVTVDRPPDRGCEGGDENRKNRPYVRAAGADRGLDPLVPRKARKAGADTPYLFRRRGPRKGHPDHPDAARRNDPQVHWPCLEHAFVRHFGAWEFLKENPAGRMRSCAKYGTQQPSVDDAGLYRPQIDNRGSALGSA